MEGSILFLVLEINVKKSKVQSYAYKTNKQVYISLCWCEPFTFCTDVELCGIVVSQTAIHFHWTKEHAPRWFWQLTNHVCAVSELVDNISKKSDSCKATVV